MAVTFGYNLPTGGRLTSAEAVRTLAQHAEAVGFDSLWVADHIIIPRQVSSFYPYAPDHVSTFNPNLPMYEPLSVLTFLAGCTQRIRLGTNVLIIPYRNPVYAAKQLAMLDVWSGGRLIVGAGAGWMEEEFRALGLTTFAERGAVTSEYLRLFKELWTNDSPVFHGKYYQVSDIGFLPKPVQQPHPPLWIGGHTAPALRRTAELGDGWVPIGTLPPGSLEPEELQGKIARLRALTREAGRPEDAVTLCFAGNIAFQDSGGHPRLTLQGHPEQIAADLRQYQALGVRHFICYFFGAVGGVSEQAAAVERFAREVMPLVP